MAGPKEEQTYLYVLFMTPRDKKGMQSMAPSYVLFLISIGPNGIVPLHLASGKAMCS